MDKKNRLKKNKIYSEVAELHLKYINKGFLATLGLKFLTLLYEAIDNDENSILIVEEVDNRAIGYVAGGSSMKTIYFKLILRLPELMISLLPALFSLKKIVKIAEIILFKRSSSASKEIPDEELFSIVVSPEHRGCGHAEKLFLLLCEHFKNKGVSSFKILVGEKLSRAHNFYLKLGSKKIDEVELHKGDISFIYVKSLK